MGLPQLTFELKKAADTMAARATQGIAGMIPRDTRALGVHVKIGRASCRERV